MKLSDEFAQQVTRVIKSLRKYIKLLNDLQKTSADNKLYMKCLDLYKTVSAALGEGNHVPISKYKSITKQPALFGTKDLSDEFLSGVYRYMVNIAELSGLLIDSVETMDDIRFIQDYTRKTKKKFDALLKYAEGLKKKK